MAIERARDTTLGHLVIDRATTAIFVFAGNNDVFVTQ
jgi:hypothetical protein